MRCIFYWLVLETVCGRTITEAKISDEELPTAAEERHLHHSAHEQCYIANSVKSEVHVERQQHDK